MNKWKQINYVLASSTFDSLFSKAFYCYLTSVKGWQLPRCCMDEMSFVLLFLYGAIHDSKRSRRRAFGTLVFCAEGYAGHTQGWWLGIPLLPCFRNRSKVKHLCSSFMKWVFPSPRHFPSDSVCPEEWCVKEVCLLHHEQQHRIHISISRKPFQNLSLLLKWHLAVSSFQLLAQLAPSHNLFSFLFTQQSLKWQQWHVQIPELAVTLAYILAPR